jgi:predicted nucleic acid-binding protein
LTSAISKNSFWDSCVVGRFLTEKPPEHVSEIATLLAEAKAGKRQIYASTLMIAEVRPSWLRGKGYGSFQDFVADFEGALNLIGPTPTILMQAARLRDHSYHRTPKQALEKNRVMSGMDAVHLATCLHVRDVLGITDIEFHTFDDGKGKNYEERAVSLLNFQDFSVHVANDPDVALLCKLPRIKPSHPAPQFSL